MGWGLKGWIEALSWGLARQFITWTCFHSSTYVLCTVTWRLKLLSALLKNPPFEAAQERALGQAPCLKMLLFQVALSCWQMLILLFSLANTHQPWPYISPGTALKIIIFQGLGFLSLLTVVLDLVYESSATECWSDVGIPLLTVW